MQKKTIFLLQDTNEQNEQLKNLFEQEKDYEVVGHCTDGVLAVTLIAEKKPKVLIVELILSGYDGLSVISKVKSLGLATKIVVLSALKRDEIVRKAVESGADYFMAKPFNFDLLKARVDEILEEDKKPLSSVQITNRNTIDEKISNIFLNVGIPAHIKGYSFLREGVKMAIETPEIVNNITKQLYPKIGERYSTSASKVERAIRHAIEVAWSRGRIENINTILGVRAFVGKEKPTNGEFIALVADKMILEKA